eukprot:TRINITY_DN7521_c0_g1_i2.p1 TRINITY_DN7521_c0_g1~~TRINITY_DN7521_c0_g1_i2.p1  ORF type:complete len:181 (-),score=54.79 TRINITY_DN7521_c0_g1_i2:66-608(-)
MALLFDITRTATIQAQTDVILLSLKRDDFEKIKNENVLKEIRSISTKRFERFKLKLKEACLAKNPSKNLDKESIEYFRKVFNGVDVDKNEKIDRDEFNELVKKLNAKALDKKSVEKIFDKIDTDKSGTIEFQEFLDSLPLLRDLCFPPPDTTKNWLVYTSLGLVFLGIAISVAKNKLIGN